MNNLPKYISFLKENKTKEQATEIYEQRIKDSAEIYEKFAENFIERDCPVCGSNYYKENEKFNKQYGVVTCYKCSSMFVNPTPNLEALDYYYNNCECNRQWSKLLKERAGKKGVILSDKLTSSLNLIDQLLKVKSEIRVLEVGSNSGEFLHELNQALIEKGCSNKVSLIGIDINESVVKKSVYKDISLFHSSAEAFVGKSEQSFDLILHFELIEHLNNPFEFCCALYKLLNDEGLMYFHTPNALGLDNQALSYNEFRPSAHGIFPPMHLNAFTTQNVSHFLIRAGFSVREIKTPGNFDVDIVKEFCGDNNELSLIKKIEDKQSLAILQVVLRILGASSHMAVLAVK